MSNSNRIKGLRLYYKMGVMCGNVLYFTYKFDDFEKMMKSAKDINNKYKGDMQYCTFVIQAFKDNSYDFKKACFCQIKVRVSDIETGINNVIEKILSDYESEVQENDSE